MPVPISNYMETTTQKFDRNRRRVKNCPCGKNNRDGKFVPYVGSESEGYCHSCGETFTGDNSQRQSFTPMYVPPKPVDYFTRRELMLSRGRSEENNLLRFLYSRLPEMEVRKVEMFYFIGTTKMFNGGTVFWQIDRMGNIRTAKIIGYDSITGKRVQKPKPQVTWEHSVSKDDSFSYLLCLFGEHLLFNGPTKHRPVALVESEKSAIIGAIYLPEFVWLATGGKGQVGFNKLSVLENKEVIMFPDLKGYDEWKRKSEELISEINVKSWHCSDLLETIATEQEREQGLDIADYLLRYTLDEFRDTLTSNPIKQKCLEQVWLLDEVEEFFQAVDLPPSIQLDKCTHIGNVQSFINSHISCLRANYGVNSYRPYYDRLIQLQLLILKQLAS